MQFCLDFLFFLIFQSRGWIGITACVVLGFAIGAVPGGILSFPVSAFTFHASAWATDTPPTTNGLITAAIWGSYIKPIMYLGLLGAFGGLVFWVILTVLGHVGSRWWSDSVGCRPQPMLPGIKQRAFG